jgi:hypothetical protein
MDYLNRELEASINDLRAQPGVNPTDVERLQASIMSDGALLVSLNADRLLELALPGPLGSDGGAHAGDDSQS